MVAFIDFGEVINIRGRILEQAQKWLFYVSMDWVDTPVSRWLTSKLREKVRPDSHLDTDSLVLNILYTL